MTMHFPHARVERILQNEHNEWKDAFIVHIGGEYDRLSELAGRQVVERGGMLVPQIEFLREMVTSRALRCHSPRSALASPANFH
jgi:hypothetical protein